MRFLVRIGFHYGAVENMTVLVSADDRGAAKFATFETFGFYEDWAVKSVSVVREAGPEDEGKFATLESFR